MPSVFACCYHTNGLGIVLAVVSLLDKRRTMKKIICGTACWCMVMIGMDAPTGKKYSLDIVFKMKDIQTADELEQNIKQGTCKDFEGTDGKLLSLLVRYNKEKLVEKLLSERGIKPSLEVLQEAIVYGRTSIALHFIDQEPSLIREQNRIGSPLHIASLCNRVILAGKLLEMGTDVNVMNQYHDTPLHLAAKRGHEEMVSFLCERGANPFVTNIRKYGRRFDSMDVAYRHMGKKLAPGELPHMMVERYKLYREILHIMYRYVGKFGGSVC